MFRILFVTFWGKTRASHEVAHHIHESPTSMTMPLVVLAVLTIVGGYFSLLRLLEPVFGELPEADVPFLIRCLPTVMGLGGIGLAYQMYVRDPGMAERLGRQLSGLYRLLLNKYYVDELYDAVVVRPTAALSTTVLWKGADEALIDGSVNGVGK